MMMIEAQELLQNVIVEIETDLELSPGMVRRGCCSVRTSTPVTHWPRK